MDLFLSANVLLAVSFVLPWNICNLDKDQLQERAGFPLGPNKHENAKSHMNAFKTWKVFNAREARDLRVDVMYSQARREEIKRHKKEVW